MDIHSNINTYLRGFKLWQQTKGNSLRKGEPEKLSFQHWLKKITESASLRKAAPQFGHYNLKSTITSGIKVRVRGSSR